MGSINAPDCLRCQTKMEVGFTMDRNRNVYTVPEWIPGLPDPGLFGFLHQVNEPRRQVLTFCCPRCGYLESYVPRAAEQAG